MPNFTKLLNKITSSLEARDEQALAAEVKRLTMNEMFGRLTTQRSALLKLVDAAKEYLYAKHEVTDIAQRLKDSGIFSKSQASQICKQCEKVHTTIEILDENATNLKEHIDYARREVE